MDTGLLGLLVMDSETAQLENLVAIELGRRYGIDNIYYYESNIEVDFYVPDANLAIQVSYSVFEDPDMWEREFSAFAKLCAILPGTKCVLVSNSEEAVMEHKGILIHVVPAWKWMLQDVRSLKRTECSESRSYCYYNDRGKA